MAPEPTEADRARDLHADLAFLAEKDAIPKGCRPPVWDVEDDVDVSACAYRQGAWPAAIRRALAAEAGVAALHARVAALEAVLRAIADLPSVREDEAHGMALRALEDTTYGT